MTWYDNPLLKRIEELEAENARLRAEVEALRKRVAELEAGHKTWFEKYLLGEIPGDKPYSPLKEREPIP